MSAGPGLSLPLLSSPFIDSRLFSCFFCWSALCLQCRVKVIQNHLLQPQPAGYTSCFVLRFNEISLSFHSSLWPNGFFPGYNTHSYQTACIFPLTLQRDKRGEPIDPSTLSCYRLDHFGQKATVPNLLCRYRAKPTRLPCTTTSSPTEQGKEHTAAPTDPTAFADKNGSQSYRHQNAIFTSVLVPEFQILQEYYNLG